MSYSDYMRSDVNNYWIIINNFITVNDGNVYIYIYIHAYIHIYIYTVEDAYYDHFGTRTF